MKQTKTIAMTVTVRVPKWMTAHQARREVRSLINDQCYWMGDIFVKDGKWHEIKVRAQKVEPRRAA